MQCCAQHIAHNVMGKQENPLLKISIFEKMNEFSIQRVVTETNNSLKRNLKKFVFFSSPFICLSILNNILDIANHGYLEKQAISTILITVSLFFIYALSAIVKSHQIYLTRDLDSNPKNPLLIGLTEIRVGLLFLGIGLLSWIISIIFVAPIAYILSQFDPPSYLRFILSNIPTLPLAFIFARFSLAIPARCINADHHSIGWSWNVTSKDLWKLFVLLGLIPLGLTLFQQYLSLIPGYVFISTPIYLVATIYEIGFLSNTYLYFSKQPAIN